MLRWADIELLVIKHLRTETGVRVVSRLPGDLEKILPVIRVLRGPGTDDGITDSPLVDVHVFHEDIGDAYDLAETVREAMHGLRGRAVDGSLVDSVSTAVGPVYMDYENPAVERVVASYRIAQRKSQIT